MKKTLALFLALALMLCGAAMAETVYPYTVTDMGGNEITIEEQPTVVVSLTPSNTEVLYALGAGALVKGVDSYSNYPAEAAENATIVGSYADTDIEAVLALEPDVVFAGAGTLQEEARAQLADAGVVVVESEAMDYASIPASIQLVAGILNIDAQPLLTEMSDKEAALLESAPEAGSCTVYFALSFGEYGEWSAGPGTFIDTMITMAGGTNIMNDPENPWPNPSLESILEADPDVILVSGGDEMAQLLLEGDAYQDLTAVQNGHVYGVDADMSNRPGPRIVDSLGEFVAAINDALAAEE
ncbi:MAG TPA: ABC transporter substrate-binding protein [Candidatus Alectryocaccomicrobium excrementavium]|uniref:ABC transporter substrate-binding protein n=1 Tax=Candidatus Alectryocaccomicrobium excrementavium TaxID=2840668 RepID=A0A9D1K870_9FIRM|nr:ABC transporter substrate-binding protein [Candidatus Alectryocaccomicrobium excrementavium]